MYAPYRLNINSVLLMLLPPSFADQMTLLSLINNFYSAAV